MKSIEKRRDKVIKAARKLGRCKMALPLRGKKTSLVGAAIAIAAWDKGFTTWTAFSKETGVSLATMTQITGGIVPLSIEAAYRVELVTGQSWRHWMDLDLTDRYLYFKIGDSALRADNGFPPISKRLTKNLP